MFEDCQRFQQFREELDRHGITLRPLWSTKTDPDSVYDNVALFNILGGANTGPSTVVIQSHGRFGFSAWYENGGNSIEKDIAEIKGTIRRTTRNTTN